MKFSLAAVASLYLADHALAFVAPQSPVNFARTSRGQSSSLRMAVDMPPAAEGNSDLPVIQQNSYGQPTDVRYSDFLRLVNSDRVEKVTFSSDGTQLLGVDVDGARLKIESLPNDPDLLTSLTNHKVC
jgi:cell division protease FtsH